MGSISLSDNSGDIKYTQERKFAHKKPKNGLVIHSDKGSQFRSEVYRIFLSSFIIIQSFTSLNHSCVKNASQELFHASHKKSKTVSNYII